MNWQREFSEQVIKRGADYFRRGHVTDIDISEDFIKGSVCGSRVYDVKIKFSHGEITEMKCSCPYAFDGNDCKHMAAVLFYADNLDSVDKEHAKNNQENLVNLVKEADETVVRDFLTTVLKNDEKLLNRFKSTLNCELTSEDMKRYKKQIDNIFNEYEGRHGFIDYYSASKFARELEGFLDDDILGMVENEQYEEAFELTNEIFIKVGNLHIDDSEGYLSILAGSCMEIWQGVLADSNDHVKRQMFRWFIAHLNGSVIDYMEDYLEELLFDNFKEEEFLAEKLEFIDKQMRTFEKEENSWSNHYAVGKWALRYLGILEEQNVEEDIIDAYLKKYIKYNKVRKYYVERCINRKAYDEAIYLLEEGKQIDKDSPGLVIDYSMQLKDIYKQIGNEQAYKNELWAHVLEYKKGDLYTFNELKTLYSEEDWEKQREIVFEGISPNSRINILYDSEKMYDRLLQVVLESPSIYLLETYEESLKKLYPQELLNKYEAIVREMAIHTSDRKRYREIVKVLRKMQKYPEGKQKVAKILTDWRFAYSNRSAMMDELSKI